MRWALGILGCAAVAFIVLAAVHVAADPAQPQVQQGPVLVPVAQPSSSRLNAGGWETVRQAIRLRSLALGRHRTAAFRAFSAYLGLKGLMSLRPVRAGRCATAVLYLYDNLLDLLHAYPGENWQPLRALIRTQPPLDRCVPLTARTRRPARAKRFTLYEG